MVPKRYEIWCPDIINSSVIPDIPTIPDIPIFIKISSRLWFWKSMTLDIYLDIFETLNVLKILNIPEILNIPDISTIPEITIII